MNIMRTNSIPILLMVGFLGSGKTSLLNHLLKNKQGLKIGVIINDFGKINIDSMLVAAQTDETLELSNGCICCSIDEEGGLTGALNKLAHIGSRLDYIVIEASGLAEPRELATSLRLIKNNYCHFDALINIVDAENFEKNNKTSDTIMDDLGISDIIIINKTDLVSDEKLSDIEKAIRLVAPKSRLLKSTHGQVDFRLLMNVDNKISAQLPLGSGHDHDHDHEDHQHLHDQFQSISFQTSKPLDPQKIEEWAKNIDANIFRAKGIIFFGMKGMGQKFIFQAVGQRYALKLDEWTLNQTPQTNLVIIGTNLDKQKIEIELHDLIDDQPENVSAETLIDIFEYK